MKIGACLWLNLLSAACNGGIMNVGEPTGDGLDSVAESRGTDTDRLVATDAPMDGGGDASDLECFSGGVSYRSGCWYLGAPGQSCDTVCASRGGYNSLTEDIVGTPDQGGDWTGCRDIFRLLGFSGEVGAGYRDAADEGVGCHLWNGQDLWWLYSPDFSRAVGIRYAQIVCACLGI